MLARLSVLLLVVLGLVVIVVVSLTADTIIATSAIEPNSGLLSRDYPGWVQVNEAGFGDPDNGIWSLTTFGGNLYANTCRESGAAQVWRSANGTAWSQVAIPGWPEANTCIMDAMVFGSYLYLGTMNESGAEIWRTNGTTWERVVQGGFGNANNVVVSAFAVFGGQIYAVAGNFVSGNSLWRSATGAAGSWQQVPIGAMGGAGTFPESTLDIFGSYLYFGFSRNGKAELWRSNNGVSWSPVFTGTQSANNTHVTSMAVFNGMFYIGFRNSGGAQVWRSTNGTSWSPVFTDGLGKPGNTRAYGLIVYNNKLYVVFGNYSGAEIWRTANGTLWEPVMQGGWGDGSVIFADYFDKAATVFQNRLYIATISGADGGEIWKKTITADFMAYPTLGQPPLSVAFTNISAGDYTTSTWSFGDGGMSTATHPTRVYNTVGTYTVTLTIGDGVETSTITRPAYIRAWHQLYTPVILGNYQPE